MSELDLDGMTDNMDQVDSNISDLESSGDLTNPSNEIQLQEYMYEMESEYETISAVISDYKTVALAIAQKM